MRAVPFSRCAEEEQKISSNICSSLSPPLPLDCTPSFWEKEISSFWLYKSKNRAMVWVGRALKDHLLPIPPGASASFKHKGKESQICLFCCCFFPKMVICGVRAAWNPEWAVTASCRQGGAAHGESAWLSCSGHPGQNSNRNSPANANERCSEIQVGCNSSAHPLL